MGLDTSDQKDNLLKIMTNLNFNSTTFIVIHHMSFLTGLFLFLFVFVLSCTLIFEKNVFSQPFLCQTQIQKDMLLKIFQFKTSNQSMETMTKIFIPKNLDHNI